MMTLYKKKKTQVLLLKSMTWITSFPDTTNKYGGSSCQYDTVNGYLYIFGGRFTTFIEKIEITTSSNFMTKSWSTLNGRLPNITHRTSSILVPEKRVIIITAIDNSGTLGDTIAILNLDTDEVRVGANILPTPVRSHVTLYDSITTKVFVFGGNTNVIQNSQMLATLSPTYNPSLSPSKSPTSDPTLQPTKAPTPFNVYCNDGIKYKQTY
eukprot:115587_1